MFEGSYDDGLEDAAERVGTTWKTVKTSRQRIRNKARAWAAQEAIEASGVTMNPQRPHAARREGSETRSANMNKPWGQDRELLALVRPMTPDELADMRAGYPASRYRRRAAVWGVSPDLQGEGQDAETVLREAA